MAAFFRQYRRRSTCDRKARREHTAHRAAADHQHPRWTFLPVVFGHSHGSFLALAFLAST
jgi:hypothetical protein